MKFIKPFDEVVKPETYPGNTHEAVYMQRYDEEGRPYLEEARKENLVAKIRSFKDSCSISALMKKYIASGGDDSVLNVRKGFYLDLSEIPKNVPAIYDAVERAKAVFKQLPYEVQASYHFNPAEMFEDRARKAMEYDKVDVKEVKEQTENGDISQ